MTEPDRNGDPNVLFNGLREAGQSFSCAGVVEPFCPGQVQKRFINGDRLHSRREIIHMGANLSADADIFLHVSADDDSVRA